MVYTVQRVCGLMCRPCTSTCVYPYCTLRVIASAARTSSCSRSTQTRAAGQDQSAGAGGYKEPAEHIGQTTQN